MKEPIVEIGMVARKEEKRVQDDTGGREESTSAGGTDTKMANRITVSVANS